MRRLIALASLCSFLFALGCSSVPMTPLQKFGGKKSHRKANKIAQAEEEDDEDVDDKEAVEKRLIVQDETDDEDAEKNEDDVFGSQSKHRTRIKESDGLSKLLEDFIDPRTVSINRNLGYE